MMNILKNVAIFIDLENVYYGLKRYNIDPDHPNNKHNLFLRLQEYYGKDSIRMIEAYADFENMDISMISLQKKRVHVRQVYSNGFKRCKNAADIQLCLDAMEIMYQMPDIYTFVIVSADQDMLPLLDRLWSKGKRVELFCLYDESLSRASKLHEFCDCTYNLFDFLNIDKLQNLSPMDRMVYNAITHIYEWSKDPNNANKNYGENWIKRDLRKKFKFNELKTNHLFNYLVKNRLLCSYETMIDKKVYLSYKVNLEHPQVQNIVKIAGYKVS